MGEDTSLQLQNKFTSKTHQNLCHTSVIPRRCKQLLLNIAYLAIDTPKNDGIHDLLKDDSLAHIKIQRNHNWI